MHTPHSGPSAHIHYLLHSLLLQELRRLYTPMTALADHQDLSIAWKLLVTLADLAERDILRSLCVTTPIFPLLSHVNQNGTGAVL